MILDQAIEHCAVLAQHLDRLVENFRAFLEQALDQHFLAEQRILGGDRELRIHGLAHNRLGLRQVARLGVF